MDARLPDRLVPLSALGEPLGGYSVPSFRSSDNRFERSRYRRSTSRPKERNVRPQNTLHNSRSYLVIDKLASPIYNRLRRIEAAIPQWAPSNPSRIFRPNFPRKGHRPPNHLIGAGTVHFDTRSRTNYAIPSNGATLMILAGAAAFETIP